MWSHYASDHSGIVIGFDTSQRPFHAVDVMKVEYGKEKPLFTHQQELDEFGRELMKVAKQRFEHWRYEHEVRIMIPRKGLRERRYIGLDPRAIVSVCFGCRSADLYRQRVRTALQRPHFQYVKLYEARLNPSDYRLNIVPCP